MGMMSLGNLRRRFGETGVRLRIYGRLDEEFIVHARLERKLRNALYKSITTHLSASTTAKAWSLWNDNG